jgi:ATP synthase protein I
MDNFKAHLKTVQNVFLFFLSFCLVGWALLVDYRVYFAGLMLGSIAGMINAKYLAWKIHKLAAIAIEQKGRKKMNLGFLTRAAIVGLAAVVALRYPQHVALSTTVAGYFFAQLVTIVLGILSIRKAKK